MNRRYIRHDRVVSRDSMSRTLKSRASEVGAKLGEEGRLSELSRSLGLLSSDH